MPDHCPRSAPSAPSGRSGPGPGIPVSIQPVRTSALRGSRWPDRYSACPGPVPGSRPRAGARPVAHRVPLPGAGAAGPTGPGRGRTGRPPGPPCRAGTPRVSQDHRRTRFATGREALIVEPGERCRFPNRATGPERRLPSGWTATSPGRTGPSTPPYLPGAPAAVLPPIVKPFPLRRACPEAGRPDRLRARRSGAITVADLDHGDPPRGPHCPGSGGATPTGEHREWLDPRPDWLADVRAVRKQLSKATGRPCTELTWRGGGVPPAAG